METATELGRVQGFDVESGEASRDFLEIGTLTRLAYSANGLTMLAIAQQVGISKPANVVQAIHVESGAVSAKFPHPQGTHVFDAQFSPDGRLVVSAADDHRARIWEVESGQPVVELVGHAGGVRSAMFGPTGERVVTTSEQDHSIRIWDARSGAQLACLSTEGETPANASLSPDGRRVVAGCWWGNVCLWEPLSGKRVLWKAHRGGRVAVAVFSSDGKRILTAGGWPGVRLWNSDTLEEIATLDERPSKRACFDPSGRWIVSISEDGAALLLPVDPVVRARELAPRGFTPEERARYDLEP